MTAERFIEWKKKFDEQIATTGLTNIEILLAKQKSTQQNSNANSMTGKAMFLENIYGE